MMRIFFFLAGFVRSVWERSGPSSDPFGKPPGQGWFRDGDGG